MKLKSMVLVFALLLTFSATATAAIKKSTIRVDGMHCKNCSRSVAKALKATPGVTKVDVSHERKEAVVEYDDEKVTESKLREVINGTGFKAVEDKQSP